MDLITPLSMLSRALFASPCPVLSIVLHCTVIAARIHERSDRKIEKKGVLYNSVAVRCDGYEAPLSESRNEAL